MPRPGSAGRGARAMLPLFIDVFPDPGEGSHHIWGQASLLHGFFIRGYFGLVLLSRRQNFRRGQYPGCRPGSWRRRGRQRGPRFVSKPPGYASNLQIRKAALYLLEDAVLLELQQLCPTLVFRLDDEDAMLYVGGMRMFPKPRPRYRLPGTPEARKLLAFLDEVLVEER